MGLDMYLDKRVWNFETEDTELTKVFNELEKQIGRRPQYICLELMYWRKTNAIHKWFVENVQEGKDDCEEYYVSREQLQQLLDLVNEVLKDKKKAKVLLPTQTGFFFGGTEYDKCYFEDMNATKKVLEKELASSKKNAVVSYRYSSSW